MKYASSGEWSHFFRAVSEIIRLPMTANERTAHLKKAIDEWEEESDMMELCAMLQAIYPDA